MEANEQPHILVNVFLMLHNREVDRGVAITGIIRAFERSRCNDLALSVLGSVKVASSNENVGRDVCVLLQLMKIKEYDAFVKSVEMRCINAKDCGDGLLGFNALACSQGANDPPVFLCRKSMLNLQRAVLRDKERTSLKTKESAAAYDRDKLCVIGIDCPPDLPVSKIAWNQTSAAVRQGVLILASIRLDAITNKDTSIELLTGHCLQASLHKYVVPVQRAEEVCYIILPFMLRIGTCIDTNCTMLLTVDSFAEKCFKGIFGDLQRSVMTRAFLFQMYVVAYMLRPMQIRIYNLLVTRFNKYLQSSHPELLLPLNIPANLIENMQIYTAEEKFPDDFVVSIFKPMCV